MYQKLKSIINMKSYFFTFGQLHIHDGKMMKDYFIEIVAESSDIARQLMFARYSDKWGFEYTEYNFTPSYFPKGCYEKISQLSPVAVTK